MNKIVHIKIFNDILDQFFDYLDDNFLELKSDLVLVRTTTEFVRKSNPRLVVEQFMTNVLPYKKKIFDCDEDFFLNYESILSKNGNQSNIMHAMKLKNLWLSDITQHQKAYIWLHFQRLLKAGEKALI